MENKSIKVIDEHNIDREANVICAIDVDGSDYIVYSIERDSDNDNIFVSKLIKNINDTANMVNIDDSMEKERMASLVKELIKYAIDNDSLSQNDRKVSLPSGKVVNIVLATVDKKEQNINVQKTYITTVKKAVTKVSEDFYKVDFDNVNVGSQMDNIFPNFEVPLEKDITPLPDIIPSVVESNKEEDVNTVPEIQTIDSTIPNIINPVVEDTPSNIDNSLSNDTSVSQNIANPIVSDIKIESSPVAESNIDHSQDLLQTVLPEPVSVNQSPILEPQVMPFSIPSSPIESEEPVVNKVDAPVNPQKTVLDNKIIFDGSKESNLNEALGEVSDDKILSTDNVEPIREFGVDEIKESSSPINVPDVNSPLVSDSNGDNNSSAVGGFVNNKYFTVISILFFVAACVFLGYEAFRYFQLVK